MKKFLFLCAMLFSFGVAVPSVGAATIPEGAIIKTANNPDVYIVKYNKSKMYKRLVLNPLVFQSYGHLKWENLLVVSDGEMDSYTTSDIVRVDGTTDAYQLVPEGDNGGKYLLTSMDSFDMDSVYTINSVDFTNYALRGSKAARYVKELTTKNGKVEISSNMSANTFVLNSPEDDVPISSLNLNMWYGFDTPQYMLDQYDPADADALSKTYILGVRIIELKDLEKLYFSVKLPDGRIAYAKNFKVARLDGKWQLDSEHDGIYMAVISDDYTEMRVYDWTIDSMDIIPDTFQNKEFGFYVYIYMGE